MTKKILKNPVPMDKILLSTDAIDSDGFGPCTLVNPTASATNKFIFLVEGSDMSGGDFMKKRSFLLLNMGCNNYTSMRL